MKIAYNASAVLANNALTRNDNKLADSLARLSSGLKVVSAKDNPSGLAMARRMNAQIASIGVATQNAGDAISVIEIADGALSEVHDVLQRINELTVKASTETITDEDRALIQDEVDALKSEITRISETTEFNGQTILDGSFDLRGYTDNVDVKVTSYSDNVKTGIYEIDSIDVVYDANGNIDFAALPDKSVQITDENGDLITAEISAADGNVMTLTGVDGFELKLELRGGVNQTFTNLNVNVAGFGSMDMQVGANEGQQLDVRIFRLSLENIGLSNTDVSTLEGARDALSKMDGAVDYVSSTRSHMGAYQNRLEHTISNLNVTTENVTAAYSRIMDVDMAEEMTKYTTMQVLSQASTSMLAQANERPSQVLQLLQ
ncbi:MAG: flagellin [Lachnospiraceae bacterium]|jgi:flagellin|nr:flagellin [Lachnospiraceae bacterium]